MEFAFNSVIHASGPEGASDLIAISLRDGHVGVWMFGSGRPAQVNRLERIIKSIYRIATPPDHQQTLLARRNEEAWRQRKLPESETRGAGVGMLTVAALSSRKLYFLKNLKDKKMSFVLQSVV